MWGIYLHGKMDRKWMRMYRRGLTGLALQLSGANYSFIVDYHTSQQLTLTMYPLYSIHR